MVYKKIKGRSEQGRVSKKTQIEKKAGSRAAKINNKKASLKTKAKAILFNDSAVNLAKNKNVSPAYLTGYKAALKQMGIKNDATLARNKAEKRVSKRIGK
jgi:hypothetical protein